MEYALGTPGHAMGCVWHCQPPHAHSSPAPPLRLLLGYLSYFSVYLSISQYSRFRISGISGSGSQVSQVQDLRISQLYLSISQLFLDMR